MLDVCSIPPVTVTLRGFLLLMNLPTRLTVSVSMKSFLPPLCCFSHIRGGLFKDSRMFSHSSSLCAVCVMPVRISRGMLSIFWMPWINTCSLVISVCIPYRPKAALRIFNAGLKSHCDGLWCFFTDVPYTVIVRKIKSERSFDLIWHAWLVWPLC